MEKNIVSLKITLDLRKISNKARQLNLTIRSIRIASKMQISTTMKLSIKMKTYLRKKTNNRMMNQFCTHNIMKTKMILIMTTHKWHTIFHHKKEAMHKMKKENTTMDLTTMKMIVTLMKPTLKTKMRINILKATLTTSKAFTMKSDKAVE
jgi:hypothetical protein